MNKDENGAFKLFENMSENSMNNASIVAFNRTSQPRNVHEVDTGPSHSSTDLSLIAQKLDEVSVVHKKLDELLANPTHSMANTPTSPLHHNPNSSNTRLIPRNPVRPSLPSVVPSDSVSHVDLASASQYFDTEDQASVGSDAYLHADASTGIEDACALGNNPFSTTYNPGWRNHPNFAWSNNPQRQNPAGGPM